MKQLFIYALFLFSTLFAITACDTATEPEVLFKDVPAVTTLNISPKSVSFSKEGDGFKDTTITLSIHAEAINLTDLIKPRFAVTRKDSGNTIVEGELDQLGDSGEYGKEISINTTTTSYNDYIVNVFLINDYGKGNYAQAILNINGFSNFPPEILTTIGPELINRPSEGSVPAIFIAKVRDRDGQDTIENVFIRVINQSSGEVTGSPFFMANDGSNYGDETANDSLFTWSQDITPTQDNPDRDFNIEFYAVDEGGLISDTVRTTFKIRE